VDIVFLATPPAWRPIHFEAAIEANKHVFCEKPFGTDPVHVRRFMAAAKKSEEKKLTVVSGAQRRSDPFYLDMIAKVHSGELGDVMALYAYWVGSPVIQNPNGRKEGWGDFEWQHRNWYSNLWLCGDQIVEQHLHNIDVCNWIMRAHPVKCWASGGAVWRPRAPKFTATSTTTSRPTSNTKAVCACRATAGSTTTATSASTKKCSLPRSA